MIGRGIIDPAELDALFDATEAEHAADRARGDPVGVQVRMLPVLRAFLEALVHERNRGTEWNAVLNAMPSVLANLVVNFLATTDQGLVDRLAVVGAIASSTYDRAAAALAEADQGRGVVGRIIPKPGGRA